MAQILSAAAHNMSSVVVTLTGTEDHHMALWHKIPGRDGQGAVGTCRSSAGHICSQTDDAPLTSTMPAPGWRWCSAS